jgi:periplasmic protein TonB
MKNVSTTSFIYSVSLHGFLLGMLLLAFHATNSFHIKGQTTAVQAYFVHQTPTPHPTILAQTRLNITPTSRLPQSKTSPITPQPKSRTLSGKNENDLITKLYHAIDAHKSYPSRAKMLSQSGTTLVNMTLLPSGEIQAVNLAHSSGYTDLDHAALEAVKASSPIQSIKTLLPKTTRFTVPIRFDT